MARITVGGSDDDYFFDNDTGRIIRTPIKVRWYSAQTGGTQYTDLLLNGQPVTEIPVPAKSVMPEHQWPDGITVAWVAASATDAGFASAPRVKYDRTPAAGGGTSDYNALTNKPNLQAVATTGAYADLTGKPTIPSTPGAIGAEVAGAAATAQAVAVQRGNHTGTQAISTVTNLQTTLDAKAATADVFSKTDAQSYATTASSATPTPSGAARSNDYVLTALAAAAAFAAPTGTPADGNMLQIVVKDNGTARAVTWNAIYKAADELTLPTTTVVGKTHYWLFRYNGTSAKWVYVDYRTES